MTTKTLKAMTTFIKGLRTSRGYNPLSTSEWRRLSMKLSDVGLIQYARRIAYCLEIDKGFLVGVDEQDFSPKIYILNETKFCVISVYKKVDEDDNSTKYILGFLNDPSPNYQISVDKEPTDSDMEYILSILKEKSVDLKDTRQKGNGGDEGSQSSKRYSK